MNSARTLFAALTLALAAAACQPPAQEAGPLSAEEMAAVRMALDSWTELYRAGDYEGLAALYAADAVSMPPNAPAVKGRAAIQAHWAGEPMDVTEYSETYVEIDGRDDLAYVWGTYSLSGTLPDGMAMSDQGKYVAILKKQADGSWRFTREIYSSDLPLPEPAASTEM